MLEALHTDKAPTPAERTAGAPEFARDWQHAALETPAFVYAEAALERKLRDLDFLRRRSGCHTLYAVKALAWADVLRLILPGVDGLAVSSLFEAEQALAAGATRVQLHFSAPAIAPAEIDGILQRCARVVFNSLAQWERFRAVAVGRSGCALRVNPGVSLVSDARYDPCRPHSKLGVPLASLARIAQQPGRLLEGLSGLHLHNNHQAVSFAGLLHTVEALETALGPLLERINWINIGGGYLFGSGTDPGPLCAAVRRLRTRYGLEVMFEPGTAVVQDACALIASVLDVFDSGGRQVVVLDTSVNHLPRVFEYQSRPQVWGDRPGAPYAYILAGRSCLAGDLFGEYAFEAPLQPGSRVLIAGAGAYSLVKASWFNGLPLPSVYALRGDGTLCLRRRFSFADYARLNGPHAAADDAARLD